MKRFITTFYFITEADKYRQFYMVVTVQPTDLIRRVYRTQQVV